MADPPAALAAAPDLPSVADLERVVAFTKEPFVVDGEAPEAALAPGGARRRAFDAALAEVEAGRTVPSSPWRQQWSLLLGLERVLAVEEPKLVDGTVLNAHQVDALSGTLTALLAEPGDGAAVVAGADGEHAPALVGEESLAVDEALEEVGESEEEDEEPLDSWSADGGDDDEDGADEPPIDLSEDPGASRRFWFEHATGAGKTVAALGFVEASRTGGVLILTHRRNLVDQFHGELRDRGYAHRIAPALLRGEDRADGPVTVETYQWYVRNAGNVSDAYTVVICDEAHTALGEKTSASIRRWVEPVFIGMTATGALIARHVTDLFPTQTSRFDLAQAARRGVISPLRCIRIPPGAGVRSIAKVPLRRGEVDTEFDQEMLAELLDQIPFNLAIAGLYKSRFDGVPGVVYAAGVRHAMHVAEALRDVGIRAVGVSGETPKRELAEVLAAYERGDVDVLVNAQLLAEGWNSPRATLCLHLAPTASKRIYQQRVGRVTRRHPAKEAGIVVDFVHPATKHDDPVVTLHSLLDRDVYRGGAIVVGPVRRGRGRRLRVERRVLPVCDDPNRRAEVFERELWRIAVEHLDWGEQHVWAALAGARVTTSGWRRARAMLHFDQSGELRRRFLLTAVQRNTNGALRLRALSEIAQAKDAEALDLAIDEIAGWPRDDKREAVKIVLLALAEKRIGRRDQANAWIWRCAEYTREVHEEYAVQRWPETKRLLGLLVNSSGGAHGRNARRLVQASRTQDRRLTAALLAAAVAHTPEGEEVLRGARTRMSRKPQSLARELLRNFPKKGGKAGKSPSQRRKRRRGAAAGVEDAVMAPELLESGATGDGLGAGGEAGGDREAAAADAVDPAAAIAAAAAAVEQAAGPTRRRRRRAVRDADAEAAVEVPDAEAEAEPAAVPARKRRAAVKPVAEAEAEAGVEAEPAPAPARRRRAAAKPAAETEAEPPAAPVRKRRAAVKPAAEAGVTVIGEEQGADEPPARKRRAPAKKAAADAVEPEAAEAPPARKRRAPAKKAADAVEPEAAEAPPARKRRAPAKKAAAEPAAVPATGGSGVTVIGEESRAEAPPARKRRPPADEAA